MYVPGTILMWTALLAGIASTVTYWLSIKEPERWRGPARQSYVLMTAAVVLGSGLLMYLLVTHDYRLHYVWAYSDNLLPLHYLISTFWGGQEGSFLLWIFWGVLLGLPLMRFARSYESRVMVVYNLTLLSLILLLVKQDPFRFHQGLTATMTPMDGQGLNPLLQNPWMVIHPPVMFIGYASLGIPFAFAIAALWMQRYDEWTKVSLPWVLLSLGSLGAAIMLGGYWAYETLGWGGYWGWDPETPPSYHGWLPLP
jgi:cytochrome c-type biogenesis protein CcmF